MRVLITGMHGTVAPAVARALQKRGCDIRPWDRSIVPVDDPEAIRAFICDQRPDWFFHIATGSPQWIETSARVCHEEGIQFLHTSSASVFASTQVGPFTLDDEPNPEDDYGRYKLECERLVRAAHPESTVVRLGWQIGDGGPGTNTIDHYLRRNVAEFGVIDGSVEWFPACSFLDDTSAAILALMESEPGLYQLDGNPGWSFFTIAEQIAALKNEAWEIRPANSPRQNNLMLDDRVRVRSIVERFL